MTRVSRWPSSLTPQERADAAREKMPRIVDQVLTLLALNEANRLIMYSPTLATQIPRSRAAHAFNLFQNSSFFFELIRLCALWDAADENRDSIPTIAKLVDTPDVRTLLRQRIREDWPKDDDFGEAQATKLMRGLDRALRLVGPLSTSARLRDLVNHRDKNIAHALSQSRAEMRGTVFKVPKYGFERKMLRVSISLVDRLYLAISNTSFAFEASRSFARGNAEALWKHCRFDIEA